ncbi:MAG: phosphatase [Bacteroidaceae bacterium]|nr:phosphatase [Bacteroidaceae bacterium]
MKTLLDVHTHTLASGHAYSTLHEMVQAAAQKGLQVLGITEHAPSIPGTCDPIYFRNLHIVPREQSGVQLLLGAELNILDTRGTLDLDETYYRQHLDIRIAGIHALCWQGGTCDENTAGLIAAIRNPWVDIISHPGDGTAALHFEPIVLAAKETQTLLEINSSSLIPARGKVAARPNNLEILRLCKHYGVPVILGSDAHIASSIADYQYALPLLAETDFPDALVMNDKPEAFLQWLSRARE